MCEHVLGLLAMGGLGCLAIADGLDLCVDYGEIILSMGSIVEIKAR